MSASTPDGVIPIPSPEGQELKGQCTRLAGELADLLAEKAHITTTVIPNIAAHYASTVGARECEQLRLEVEGRRLKCILEHIQAVENRGGRPNVEQIEAAVEDEIKDWNAKLQQMAAEVRAGRDILQHQMSLEQSAEVRKLYRALVRKLHPDVNADLADKHRALWSRVQTAYLAGNLEELKALMLVVEDIPDDIALPNALDRFRDRRNRLRESVRTAIAQLAALKESPPFALLAQLDDPGWVARRLSECDEAIAQLTARVAELTVRLSAWRGAHG